MKAPETAAENEESPQSVVERKGDRKDTGGDCDRNIDRGVRQTDCKD